MKRLFTVAVLVAVCLCGMNAQELKLKGIGHLNRYDDGEQMKSTYVGWNAALDKAIFIVDNGIYAMDYNGTVLSTPVKNPAVDESEVHHARRTLCWC